MTVIQRTVCEVIQDVRDVSLSATEEMTTPGRRILFISQFHHGKGMVAGALALVQDLTALTSGR